MRQSLSGDCMERSKRGNSVDRREFLTATGGGLLATALPREPLAKNSASAGIVNPSATHSQNSPAKKFKIPIGVFDPVYDNLSLDQMLDKVSALGIEAMEIGTGGYPGTKHCPVAELL